jgi:hypothetical protein
MLSFAPIFLACACIIPSSSVPQGGRGGQGLVPLRSTKVDVERLLGTPEETGDITWYRARGDLVGVVYAASRCQGRLLGWNVAANTVLEINVKPQNKYNLAELNLDKSKFVRAYGHVGQVYINLDEGIRYELSPDDNVETISYIPSTANNRLRCPGFPPYDGGATQYRPFDEYDDIALEKESPRLDNFAIMLQSQPDTKGYIIVYAGRHACVNEARYRAQRAIDYLLKRRRIKAQQVIAVDGGYRDKLNTELYLIPNNAPAPTPRPTISSNEVQIIRRGSARNNHPCSSRTRGKRL